VILLRLYPTLLSLLWQLLLRSWCLLAHDPFHLARMMIILSTAYLLLLQVSNFLNVKFGTVLVGTLRWHLIAPAIPSAIAVIMCCRFSDRAVLVLRHLHFARSIFVAVVI